MPTLAEHAGEILLPAELEVCFALVVLKIEHLVLYMLSRQSTTEPNSQEFGQEPQTGVLTQNSPKGQCVE